MAALDTEQRRKVWRGLMRYWSQYRTTIAIQKESLFDAVTATDTWIDQNQASYNSALPTTARNGLSLAQKTLLFCTVALCRVSVEALRRFLGSVD